MVEATLLQLEDLLQGKQRCRKGAKCCFCLYINMKVAARGKVGGDIFSSLPVYSLRQLCGLTAILVFSIHTTYYN
jgi:hypothetical protein